MKVLLNSKFSSMLSIKYKKIFRRNKKMTVHERIKESEIFRFLEKNQNRSLKGTGVTPYQMVFALANASLGKKKAANVESVSDFLKQHFNVSCEEEILHRIVSNSYTKMVLFEKNSPYYDFSELPGYIRPLYQILFQRRMKGDFD